MIFNLLFCVFILNFSSAPAHQMLFKERNGLITLTGKTVKSDFNRQEREWILK